MKLWNKYMKYREEKQIRRQAIYDLEHGLITHNEFRKRLNLPALEFVVTECIRTSGHTGPCNGLQRPDCIVK